jgi:hypothetical protein
LVQNSPPFSGLTLCFFCTGKFPISDISGLLFSRIFL